MAFTAKVKETRQKQWNNFNRALNTLGGDQKELEVGLLDGVASDFAIFKGWVNEFGAADNIPPRPWMRNSMDENTNKYFSIFIKALRQNVAGEHLERIQGNANDIRAIIGREMVDDLQRSILEFNDPRNADRTIQKKGFDDPLIETGELFDSVSYRLKKRARKVKR